MSQPTLFIPRPPIPVPAAIAVAPKVAEEGGKVAAKAIDSVPNPLEGATGLLAALSSPNLWKRIGVIALGAYLLYISILLWVGSNKNVQEGVKSAVAAAATKNPSAAVAAVGS